MNTDSVAAVPTFQDVTGSRIVAALIDMVLLAIIYFVFAKVFGDSSSSSSSFHISLNGVPAILFFLIAIAYYVIPEGQGGQTLGKKIMGIKVVTADGTPLSYGKVAIRFILRIVDGLPFLYLVGFIAIVASKRKQRIGDMAAGTVLVKA